MKFVDFESNLKRQMAPCYVVKGDELFLMDLTLQKIIEYSNIQMPELDCSYFDLENFNAQQIYNACNQMPFSGKKRVVVVKNLVNAITDSNKDILTSYLKQPNPDCVLVLIDTFQKNIFLAFEKYSEVVECKKLFPNQIQPYIKQKLDQNQKAITSDAQALLIDLCGCNLLQIMQELNKLMFCSNNPIEITDIQKLVPKTMDYQVYELTNALTTKDADRAIQILNDMLLKKDGAIILPMIANHFRRLFFCAITKLSISELASIFGVKEYAITKAKEQANKFSQRQLKNICELLTQTDYELKSGAMQLKNALYYVVINIVK